MAGGILAASGMLLASVATSLTHLYLSIGLLSGETLDKGRRGQLPPDFHLLPASSERLRRSRWKVLASACARKGRTS